MTQPKQQNIFETIMYYVRLILNSTLAVIGIFFLFIIVWVFCPILLSPMHMAIENKNKFMVELLAYTPLKNETMQDLSGSGTSAIVEAVRSGDVEILKILVKHGADTKGREIKLLREAVPHPDMIEYLVGNAFTDINEVITKASQRRDLFDYSLMRCSHTPSDEEKTKETDHKIARSFDVLIKNGLDPKVEFSKHIERYRNFDSLCTNSFELLLKATMDASESIKQ